MAQIAQFILAAMLVIFGATLAITLFVVITQWWIPLVLNWLESVNGSECIIWSDR